MVPLNDAAVRAHEMKRARRRASLMRQTVRWHWISAAICLAGMLLFAITGVTLNHADAIEGSPITTERAAMLPAATLESLRRAQPVDGRLPLPVRAWLSREMGLKVAAEAQVEWTGEEAYVALPRPGGDGWLSIDARSGKVLHESTARGAIAYLNDLHKGRNTGTVWNWFIDIFALATVVFCITGLILLQLHSHSRGLTWPLIIGGFAGPLLLALFFIH